MDEVAKYFADKLEQAIRFCEGKVREIGQSYADEVERLARRQRDPVAADFLRRTAKPDRVLARLSVARALLRRGEIVEADKALERLRTEGLFVDQCLQYPLLKAGSRVRSGGQRAAKARHGSPADQEQKAREIREAFRCERRAGLSKGEAEHKVARRFRVSTRTVRAKVTGK